MISFRKTHKVALTAAMVAYPVLVYVGLQSMPPIWIGAGLALVLAARFLVDAELRRSPSGLVFLIAGGAVLALLAIAPLPALESYPVLVSLGFAAAFAYSLIVPPSAVERMARMSEPNLPAEAVAYTRKVTAVWLGFFILNAAISAATGIWGSMEQWTLYNGLISYCLMGGLFAAEFTARSFFRRSVRGQA